MKFNGWFFLFILFLCSFMLPVSSGAAPETFVKTVKNGYAVYHSPGKPGAGQALVVALQPVAGEKLKNESQLLSMTFLKREFQLEAVAGGWRGIVAVPLGTAAGTYDLVIKSQAGVALVLPVAVNDRDYGEQRLTVKREMATPMRPENLAKIKRDRHNLKVAYGASGSYLLLSDKVRAPLNSRLTSPFGTRRLLNGKPKSPHGGVDFKAAIGIPVAAAASGQVVLAEALYYSGRIVIIDHGLSIFSLYMHLSEIDCRVGERVDRGQIIGKSGKSGRVTGPHLHWGVKIAGVFVDPLRFVDDSKHLLTIPWDAENGEAENGKSKL
ncbi:MAG: M23 family metallopeptidase [Deltaproteobacteria bacterium]|nr:M23 family metallopeptidase [Candidatus Tharpella sp.]